MYKHKFQIEQKDNGFVIETVTKTCLGIKTTDNVYGNLMDLLLEIVGQYPDPDDTKPFASEARNLTELLMDYAAENKNV